MEVHSTPKRKPIVVLASGVFDLIHYGHVRFLEEAKKCGGSNAKLIVVVARDSTVKKMKGKEPVIPEDQRRAIVEALKPVDVAVLGYEDLRIGDVIEKVKPDVIAVGYDQKVVEEAVKKEISERRGKIRVVEIGRFGPGNLNGSSKIRRKIVKEWSGSSG